MNEPELMSRYTVVLVSVGSKSKHESCIVLVKAGLATDAADVATAAASTELGGKWWPAAVLAIGSVDMLAAAEIPGHRGLIGTRLAP